MKKIKLFFIISILFCLTGCYNYRELNKLAITSAIGINKSNEGYEVIVQVINTQKQGSDSNSSGDQTKFVIYKTEGRTIQEALRHIILQSPRRLYLNHNALLIISEDIAKEGINDILDIFARDSEFRKQFMVLISKNSQTEEVMSTLTGLDTLNAKKIKDSIITDSRYLSASTIVKFEDLLSNYINNKIDVSLPSVIMVGDSEIGKTDDNIKESNPDARLILSDLAIFNGDKLVGYLNEEESINVSYLKNEINNTIYTYECEKDKFASIEIVESKTDIKSEIKKSKINISINQKANINEITCNINLEKSEDIIKLQEKIEKSLKNDILDTIDKTINEYESDIFGFEDIIYKNNPSYYKELKSKYEDDLLKNIEFNVDINLNLYAKGNILKET